MKKVLVKSVYDAFDYVLDHYYPYGMKEFAKRKDNYAVISIQDTHTDGFGFQFTTSETCADVLTLYFDDIDIPVDGMQLFSEAQAEQIIEFIRKNKAVDTLLVHCYGGESRSRAVGAFVTELLGGSSKKLFETGHPNMHVYNTLSDVLEKLLEQV